MQTKIAFSSKNILFKLFSLLIYLAVLTVGCQVIPKEKEAQQSIPSVITPIGGLTADEQSVIELFKHTRDSVVFISTNSLARDYWSRNLFEIPQGTGSGFIWDKSGHVITNYHVIKQASSATIKLADGRNYEANLVGSSPDHDIAVLKINVGFKAPLPVPIGSSHDLQVGQKVFAIGNPFGLDWSMTDGIVSALDRSLPNNNGTSIEHLIQTNAAINPGNSGGPLLDSAGRLIGINTAIYSPSGASAGIGFAIPVDTVMRVVPQIIKTGHYSRPSLGIEVDPQLNEHLSVRTGIKGVFILGILPDSEAEKAGLKGVRITSNDIPTEGDIIIAINSEEVDSVSKLLTVLDDYQAGDKVTLSIIRNGKERDVDITLQKGS